MRRMLAYFILGIGVFLQITLFVGASNAQLYGTSDREWCMRMYGTSRCDPLLLRGLAGKWSNLPDEKTCEIPVGSSPDEAMLYEFTPKNVFYYEIECRIQRKTLRENEVDLYMNCNKAGHTRWSEKITIRGLDLNRMSVKSWGTIPKNTPGGYISDEVIYRCPRL